MSLGEEEEIIIAVDVMGGDNAPLAPLLGSNIVLQNNENVKFILFGDSKKISHIIEELPDLKNNSIVIHANEVISDNIKPSVALRQYKKSSMCLAIQSVVNNEAQGIVSSGNTGALMALSKMLMKTLPGIKRPAITSSVPTLKDDCVMLDLGANIDCGAEILFQFAIMGNAYAKIVLQKAKPKIALLNIGLEDNKGSDDLREARQALVDESRNLNINFAGYIEANNIWAGDADVVVANGFAGNIALKSAEGAYKLLLHSVKKNFNTEESGFQQAFGSILGYQPGIRNGAAFLGLNGISVKSHGSADEKSFASAINSTYDLIFLKTKEKIIEEINNSMHKFYK